ncbi:WYL domain-containing protein [Butyrivibrio sp. NC2002]|uniref:helix-turn-helix transcriptional regulator n=1 Tax=Butyrivibrio sp. NC2002 TaxID=1410610 RepID=UPI002E8E07C2|nr:WYL domain-containing protein [Butyrivibrio sp. NC2002]
MILAGLRSLDSVSGSRYYGQLMEKIQAGSSEFVSGRDSILIDLSSWYRESLAPKIEVIQSAIESRHILKFTYYSQKGESVRKIEPYYVVFKWSSWYVWGWWKSSAQSAIQRPRTADYYLPLTTLTWITLSPGY